LSDTQEVQVPRPAKLPEETSRLPGPGKVIWVEDTLSTPVIEKLLPAAIGAANAAEADTPIASAAAGPKSKFFMTSSPYTGAIRARSTKKQGPGQSNKSLFQHRFHDNFSGRSTRP